MPDGRGPMSDESTENWESYYEKTGTRPPRDTLLFALDRFETELSATDRRFAIDLGCGNGRDTIELLRRSWHVLAIDAEESAIAGLTSRRFGQTRSAIWETRPAPAAEPQ